MASLILMSNDEIVKSCAGQLMAWMCAMFHQSAARCERSQCGHIRAANVVAQAHNQYGSRLRTASVIVAWYLYLRAANMWWLTRSHQCGQFSRFSGCKNIQLFNFQGDVENDRCPISLLLIRDLANPVGFDARHEFICDVLIITSQRVSGEMVADVVHPLIIDCDDAHVQETQNKRNQE